MSERNTQFTPDMPWTIEQQLKAYASAEGHTDRHEILYHTWKQNCRWFTRLLEYTTESYPRYGQHNAIHCQAVIHNIECLLGEAEIKRLSPTDCYALLMAVYMHDVGMCITEQNKRETVSSPEFLEWIDQQYTSDNVSLTNDIENLRRLTYGFKEGRSLEQQEAEYKKLYNKKLDTANSTENLIAEFRRGNHAETSANWMKRELLEPGEMSYGLSLTGIPKRIHLTIADCALLHGVAAMEELMPRMMAMQQEDNGFASDLYHPRFISVLLLMGDALDLDNDRFHPNARAMAGGNLGEVSEVHYRKHQAIRSLQITPKKIYIRADCEKPAEMRMLRNDISWLQKFVTECSYQWSQIAPDDYCGYLPRVDFEQISLGGKPIAERLVKAQFHLSQQKAFKLLEGASLYENHFVYLREMLQNAIDAVKLQYWNDLDSTEFQADSNVKLSEANDELPLRKYPIKIDFAIRKRLHGHWDELQPVTLEDLTAPNELSLYDIGVEVSVQDCGIGIGEEDIVAISKVGTSQDHRRNFIRRMPDWLLPTGKFGIGLQSLFQADRLFKCVTRTHRNECYEMTFHSGTNNEGYINVIPRDWYSGESGSVPYGTRFTLFVPHTLKESHTNNMAGWAGMDPYSEEYDISRSLRRAFEMMMQMEAQLDAWIGECLFPVVIREEQLDVTLRQENWDKKIAPHKKVDFKKITFKIVDYKIHNEKQCDIDNGPQCWIFQTGSGEEPLYGHLEDKSAYYYMDAKQCRLHIWSETAKCFFACSAKRIVQTITKGSNSEEAIKPDSKIKVFLKGLFICELVYKDDELIEYLDIKNDLLQDHLYMSRNGLSPKGEEIIRNDILPQLQETFYKVLTKINQTAIATIEKNRADMEREIVEQFRQMNMEEISCFDEKNTFFIRKRELLEKRLHSCDLFDFTLVSRHIDYLEPDAKKTWCYQNQASEVRERECTRNKIDDDPGFHRLRSCITSELFSDFPRSESMGESFRKRILTAIRNYAEKTQERKLDFFSLQLNVFFEKMELIYRWFLDENEALSFEEMLTSAKWIRDFMLLHAMFFFYVNQASLPEKKGCTSVNKKLCGWSHTNSCIAHALKIFSNAEKTWTPFRKEGYVDVEQMLFIPAFTEEKLSSLDKYRCSIAELMLTEEHFAVFSTRLSPFDPWKHILIKLLPLTKRPVFLSQPFLGQEEHNLLTQIMKLNDEPNILDVLQYTPHNKTECAARWALLDNWFGFSIKSVMYEWALSDASAPREAQQNGVVQITESIWGVPATRWIARKLPSIALGSDAFGNNRLNILSASLQPEIFFDARMVWLLMERMESTYQQFRANRFMTTVWDGLGDLACEGLTSNILTVNRGLIPAENHNNRMLLACGSLLPQPITLDKIPADNVFEEIMPPAVGKMQITTFFDLLRAVQQCYQGIGDIPNFALEPLHRRMKEYRNIQELQPFYGRHEKMDLEIVQALRDYRLGDSRNTLDRNLAFRKSDALKSKIQGLFKSAAVDSLALMDGIQYDDINIPVNRNVFMCAYFITLYGFDVSDIPGDLALKLANILYEMNNTDSEKGSQAPKEPPQISLDLRPYSTNLEVEQACQQVYTALLYCEKRAKIDFHDAYLEHLCVWYDQNIWKNGEADKLLQFTQKHLSSPCSQEELLNLYKIQLRRIFCSAIAGIQTEFLK